jgi:hypothetical protein
VVSLQETKLNSPAPQVRPSSKQAERWLAGLDPDSLEEWRRHPVSRHLAAQVEADFHRALLRLMEAKELGETRYQAGSLHVSEAVLATLRGR